MYLRQHTVGSIFRNTVQIYWRNLSTILLTYALPLLPFVFLAQESVITQNSILIVSAILLEVIAGLFAYGAITVSVSDICLGHRPNFFRSYRRLAGRLFWGYLYTSLLVSLAIFFGMVFVIIPGCLAMIWFSVAFPVVVLERITGSAALQRSRNLVQNHAWKVAGLFSLLLPMNIIISVLFSFISFAISIMLFQDLSPHIINFVSALLSGAILGPINLISLVLLYYDLRVRKEAYDTTVLAQELRR